ncbi:MAG: hypothetical protein HY314_11180 [Acidobacteria bacterium]|nr:hypothetical protein [Acidobacteriota bacterium]
MTGQFSARPSGTPGRYNVTSDFPMGGTWNLDVVLANGQRAQVSVTPFHFHVSSINPGPGYKVKGCFQKLWDIPAPPWWPYGQLP